MKSLVSVALVCVAVLTLSACNTFAGIGKDVEKVGESIQRGAK